MYFNQSQNKELNNGFSSIINGKEVVLSVKEVLAIIDFDWESAARNRLEEKFPEYRV